MSCQSYRFFSDSTAKSVYHCHFKCGLSEEVNCLVTVNAVRTIGTQLPSGLNREGVLGCKDSRFTILLYTYSQCNLVPGT